MCPQKPNILLLISFLKPLINDVDIIITETLNATATMAIRMINLEKDCWPDAATFRAMK